VTSKDEQEVDIGKDLVAIHSHSPLDEAHNNFWGLPSNPLSIYHMGPTWLLPTGPQAQHIPKEARPVCTHAIVPMWHQLGEQIYKHFDSHELKWTSIVPICFAEADKEPSSLNQWHRRPHVYKTRSPIHTVSHLASYSTGRSLYKCPTPSPPLPALIGIIETIRHPHRISPAKPVIVVPVPNPIIAPHTHMVITKCHHGHLAHVHTEVPDTTTPLGHITPSCHSSALILDIISFPYAISLHLFSFFRLLQAMRVLP